MHAETHWGVDAPVGKVCEVLSVYSEPGDLLVQARSEVMRFRVLGAILPSSGHSPARRRNFYLRGGHSRFRVAGIQSTLNSPFHTPSLLLSPNQGHPLEVLLEGRGLKKRPVGIIHLG